ncbi:hypothetical protein KY338_05585 [Candidatus Woesearchaeota archaeon]|nr:hypothetical protein [Candidatus Woesearchaeota archaeon]
MKKRIFALLIICLLALPAVFADGNFDSTESTNLVQGHLSFWQKIKLGLLNIKPFAIVGGGQCSVTPDDAGSINNLQSTSFYVYCPSDSTGCRLCVYDSYYNPLSCNDMSSGSKTYVGNNKGGYWERYNCYERECVELSEFQNQGCGGWVCPDNQMYREREDSCGNIDRECIYWKDCREEQCQYTVGEWSECINNKQTRIITLAGCEKEIDTQACSGGSSQVGDVIIQAINEQVHVVDGDVVVGEATFKNVGSDMYGTYIFEMQVRPKGMKPLSIVSTEPATCDAEHPENVHKKFMLQNTEQESIRLYTLEALPDGEYDVYFLTRTKCFKDLTVKEKTDLGAFYRVSPYQYSKLVGSVCIGQACVKPSSSGGGLWFVQPFWLVVWGLLALIVLSLLYKRFG